MFGLIRVGFQVVLFFILISLVAGLASAQTGTVEKVVLVTLGVALVWLASLVRRIGAPSASQPS